MSSFRLLPLFPKQINALIRRLLLLWRRRKHFPYIYSTKQLHAITNNVGRSEKYLYNAQFLGSVFFSLIKKSSHSIVLLSHHFSTQVASPSSPFRYQSVFCIISHRVTTVSTGRSYFNFWQPRLCFGDELPCHDHNQCTFFHTCERISDRSSKITKTVIA